MSAIPARPAPARTPLHPSITVEQISDLVDEFYAEILRHPRLGPVFRDKIQGDWGPHLEKMKGFWRSVLLKTGEYKGKPVPAHQKIEGLETDDFQAWLTLFSKTCDTIFEPEAAELVLEAAQRIATSLWLSRTTDPFATPPVWQSKTPSAATRTHP